MRLQYLREFVTLATYGNFHVAAEKLYISQPTLTNHIKSLESELGFTLFDRQQGNKLTAAGSLFLDGAQTALASIDGAIRSCELLPPDPGAAQEPVRVSVCASYGKICELLACSFEGRYVIPPYDMRRSQLNGFVQGSTDIVCTYSAKRFPAMRAEVDELGLVSADLGKERCLIAMKSDNPFAHGPLTRDGLRGAEFAVLSVADFAYWKALLLEYLGPGFDATFVPFPVDTPDGLRSFDLGNRILFSQEYMVREYFLNREGYVGFDTIDGSELFMPQGIVWRPRDEKPQIEEIVEAIVGAFSEESEMD